MALQEAAGFGTGRGGQRRLTRLGLGLLAVLLVAWFLSQHLTFTRNPPVPSPTPAQQSSPYPRTEAGGVDAGTAYLMALNGPRQLDPAGLEAYARQIAAPVYANQLVKDLQQGSSQLEAVYGLRTAQQNGVAVAIRPVPLAYQVRSAWNGWSTALSIWWVNFIAVDGVLSPQALYQTSDISLVWENGWRISNGGDTVAGPGPNGDGSQLPDQLRGYREYSHVA